MLGREKADGGWYRQKLRRLQENDSCTRGDQRNVVINLESNPPVYAFYDEVSNIRVFVYITANWKDGHVILCSSFHFFKVAFVLYATPFLRSNSRFFLIAKLLRTKASSSVVVFSFNKDSSVDHQSCISSFASGNCQFFSLQYSLPRFQLRVLSPSFWWRLIQFQWK